MLAQPTVETLRLLLKFPIPDCRVLDFGAGNMECFGLPRTRVRAGSVGFCVIRACYWSGMCQKSGFLLTHVNHPFSRRVCACLYTPCMFTGPFLASGDGLSASSQHPCRAPAAQSLASILLRAIYCACLIETMMKGVCRHCEAPVSLTHESQHWDQINEPDLKRQTVRKLFIEVKEYYQKNMS